MDFKQNRTYIIDVKSNISCSEDKFVAAHSRYNVTDVATEFQQLIFIDLFRPQMAKKDEAQEFPTSRGLVTKQLKWSDLFCE